MEIITQLDKEALAEYYYTHIYDFAVDFLGHWLTSETPEFHKEIYQLLRGQGFMAIQAPRGFCKSTVCSKVFPIWAACFRHLGNISIISASEDFVTRELMTPIRDEFETNKKLIKVFGEQKTSQWSASYFKLKNDIAFEGCGINGQLRGGRRGIVILDDIESNDSVISEDQRTKIKDKINKEIIPKLFPESICVLVGTNIHQLSYINKACNDKKSAWRSKVYRAYKDKNGKIGEEKSGNELWPEVWSHKRLQERKKAIGSHAFSSEYLNNPVSDASNPIKSEQIRYWDKLPNQYTVYIALDPAYSENKESDYKVAVAVGVDVDGNRYLLEYVRTHEPLGEYMDACINLYVKYRNRCMKFGIPAGREADFYKQVVEKATRRTVFLPHVELKYTIRDAMTGRSVKEKNARIIRTLQPHFENGRYYIARHHGEAEEELLTFTHNTTHDDLVDAMSGCEQMIDPHFSPIVLEESTKHINIWEDYEPPIEELVGITGYGDY